MLKSSGLKIILLTTICVTSSNCVSMEKQTAKSKMDSKLNEIKAQIGDAPCTDSNQCKTLAIGAKPCGGPWSYRVYSTENTDDKKLQRLGLEYKSLNKKHNKESGLMSDCAMVTPPKTACVNKKCEIMKP